MKSNIPTSAPLQILFPGSDSWELWSFAPPSAPALPESPLRLSGEVAFHGAASRRVLALPVASTYSIPLWVFAKDDQELRGAAELHLEKDGLNRPDEPSGFDYARILTQENRVLIRVDALARSALPLAPQSWAPDTICLAPGLLDLPDDHIVVWKELGRLVTAMRRDGKLVYHNVIASLNFDGRAIEEVVRWAKQFQIQGMVKPCQGITIWGVEIDAADVQAKTGLPVNCVERPAPRYITAAASAIVPRLVSDLRARQRKTLRTRRLVAAAAWLAGGIILAFGAAVALSLHQQKVLRDQIASLSPAAAEIEQIQLRWREVAAAVDPDRSPLEVMWMIQQLPGASEVTLTRFERGRDRLSLIGRAVSPSEALRFLGAISKSDALSHYQWTYAQPLIAQDGSAAFEIEGVLVSSLP